MKKQNNLQTLYYSHFGHAPDSVCALKGDGSDRRIYRLVHGSHAVIGIVGNKIAEDRAFIYFSKHFKKYGLPVPDIYCHNIDKGVYLEEDLGDTTLCDIMAEPQPNQQQRQAPLYRRVLEWLPVFQIVAGVKLNYSYCYQFDHFGREAMMLDLTYFQERFLQVFYKKSLDRKKLFKDFDALIEHLTEEDSDYFLYRDFQSRNIMVQNDSVRFIDYQSGRRGALQYDLASLLYDANVTLTDEMRAELLEYYLNQVQTLMHGQLNPERFKKYYYGFAWIRIMQALGAFGFLSIVKDKKDFMKSIPNGVANAENLLHKNTILNELPTLRDIFENIVHDHELRSL